MIQINLAAIPNQSLSINLDNKLYNITLKETNGCMGVTIVRDGVTLLSNTRAVAQFPLIPYAYLESGNFVISTLNDEMPYYTQFGISQFLIYVSESELGTIRAGT